MILEILLVIRGDALGEVGHCLLLRLNIDTQAVFNGSGGGNWANARDHDTLEYVTEVVCIEELGEIFHR